MSPGDRAVWLAHRHHLVSPALTSNVFHTSWCDKLHFVCFYARTHVTGIWRWGGDYVSPSPGSESVVSATCLPPFSLSLTVEGLLTSLTLEPTPFKNDQCLFCHLCPHSQGPQLPTVGTPCYWLPSHHRCMVRHHHFHAHWGKERGWQGYQPDQDHHWHDTNDKYLSTFTMTINSALIHPCQDKQDTSNVWDTLKEKFSTPSTASKYLEFKAMHDITIPEDLHP